jgi:hypothetical protein
MSRSCRELASGLLLGRDLKIHGQTQSPKADNLQGSQGEHMSGRHSGNPESVPNSPYDVAESWLSKFGQADEWSFCLRAARMAREQERR